MLAGEPVKDLAPSSRSRRHPLQVAPPGPDRRRTVAGPRATRPTRWPRPAGASRISRLSSSSSRRPAPCSTRRCQPKRKYQVVRGLNNLGYSERDACRVVGLPLHLLRHQVPPAGPEIRHLLLADLIADIHARSRGTYGMLRVRAALEIEQGIIVNKKLVWKIMRQLGSGPPGPKKCKPPRECRHRGGPRRAQLQASAPNELWLTDITEHPTREGKVYCCVVLDMYSRKVVGWAIDRRCEAGLVNDACHGGRDGTPLRPRSSTPTTAQFTSWAFTENVRRLGLLGSMGTVGDCFDKAMVSYCTSLSMVGWKLVCRSGLPCRLTRRGSPGVGARRAVRSCRWPCGS